MINYIEKGIGLHDAIEAAGLHGVEHRNGITVAIIPSEETAIQAIIDTYDPLEDLKKEKITSLKKEGLRRVQILFPAISNFDELDLLKEQWLSIAPAARQPTADFQTLIDLLQVGKSAITVINALTIVADVKSYNVATDPVWP